MSSPTIKLNNGREMPLVGFGLWKVNNDTCADQVYNAIKTGYRLFDGACDYGNEVEAGQGVKRAIDEGLVKREDLFIVSKLWNSFHDKERVAPICKKQLADWGIDYFDLYIIHFPVAIKYVDPSVRYPPGFFYEDNKLEFSNATLEETYHAMEALYEQGLIKSLGISNYNGALLLDLFRYAKQLPQTLQIEHHPYLTQEPLLKLCKERGIAVTAYSSFGPLSFVELNMQKAKDTPMLFDHDVIKSIADAHGKTPAQVLLRWSTQRGVAVIPKSNNQSRLAQNLDVCSFDLKQDEIEKISALDKGLRFNNPTNVSVLPGCIGRGDIALTFISSTVSTSPSSLKATTSTYKTRENKTLRVQTISPVPKLVYTMRPRFQRLISSMAFLRAKILCRRFRDAKFTSREPHVQKLRILRPILKVAVKMSR